MPARDRAIRYADDRYRETGEPQVVWCEYDGHYEIKFAVDGPTSYRARVVYRAGTLETCSGGVEPGDTAGRRERTH